MKATVTQRHMQNAASAVWIGLGSFTSQRYSKGYRAPNIFMKKGNLEISPIQQMVVGM